MATGTRIRQAGRSPQDIVGGALLLAIALVAIIGVQHLPASGRVGFAAGTAPRLFGYGLGALGIIIIVQGFMREGLSLERWSVRGPLCILGSLVFFALTIRTAGLAVTGVIAVLLAAAATADFRWREALVFAVGMTVFCGILFPTVLGQPIPLWPRFQ